MKVALTLPGQALPGQAEDSDESRDALKESKAGPAADSRLAVAMVEDGAVVAFSAPKMEVKCEMAHAWEQEEDEPSGEEREQEEEKKVREKATLTDAPAEAEVLSLSKLRAGSHAVIATRTFASMQDSSRMGETSMDIARYRPPSKFLLSGPLLHVFLSFRAATEMDITATLYEALHRLSRESYAIPPGARGKQCPQVREESERPHVCKVFFCVESLLDGKDWETSICLGLAHSLVAVPLMSWGQEIDEEGNVKHTGSVGRLMNLQGDGDMVDNVLMEYILMLALKSHAEGSVQAIYPLLMGSIQQDGAYSPFPMADLDKLPNTPSYKTCDRAARLMTMMRMPAELIDDMRQRSVRNTVNMLLRHQGCHITDLRGTSALTDQFAGKVLEMMMREIRAQQDAPHIFRLRRPCALEMLEWLHETSLQPLKGVFIASGLESLQAVATLSGSRLRELCLAFEETKPKEEVKYPEELFARFEIARDKLRTEVRSSSMTQRLHRFVDNRVSWATALWSTSAAEIATQNRFCAGLLCIFALVQFVLFYGSFLEDKDYGGRIDRTVARWSYIWAYRLSDIVSCLGLLLGAFVGFVLCRPYLACLYLRHMLLACLVLSVSAPFLELLQHQYALQDSSWTLSLYSWDVGNSTCLSASADDTDLDTDVVAPPCTSRLFYSILMYEIAWMILFASSFLALVRRQELMLTAVVYGTSFVAVDRVWRTRAYDKQRIESLVGWLVLEAVIVTFYILVLVLTRQSFVAATNAVARHSAEFAALYQMVVDTERQEGRTDLKDLLEETREIEEMLDAEKTRVIRQKF